MAVLLCPGLNRDALDSHQSLRLLADEIAAAGYPTLRFDYPGTGDSRDLDEVCVAKVEHWTTWQRSVHAAADWLRRSTASGRLILCGLRIGATLAALAAETRDDVAGLALLAPVLRGHSYMRQLHVEARLRSGASQMPANGLDLDELTLSAETMGLIGDVDLRQIKLPSDCRVMVCAQATTSLLLDCIRIWTQAGAEVAHTDFGGLEPMLRNNLLQAPAADFSNIVNWMRKAGSLRSIAQSDFAAGEGAVMRHPGCIEYPVRFGAGERLFGIMCRPDRSDGKMAVVVVNTGRDPHYGPGQFGVEFARRLAAVDVASLRLDFAGLGDSLGSEGAEQVLSPLFEADRSADISAAIDVLEQAGCSRFAVQGICAGAYHALHGAVAGPRVEMLLLVNLPVFVWRSGDTIDFVRNKSFAPSRYVRKFVRKEFWSQVSRGTLGWGIFLRAQSERLYETVKSRGSRLSARLGFNGPRSFARQALSTLARRHVRTLFLFAAGDSGIQVVEQEFGRAGAGLRVFEGASMQVVEGIDHMLTGRAMRRTAADLMIGFLAAASAETPRAASLPSCDARSDKTPIDLLLTELRS